MVMRHEMFGGRESLLLYTSSHVIIDVVEGEGEQAAGMGEM